MCQPPQYIPHAPRKFNDFKIWRAHEYMHFILHFAIPVFYGIMEEEYFKHLLLLIISMEQLLSKHIEIQNLKLIHHSLCNFVQDLEKYYDVHILKSASHELIHLVMCTEVLGPINQNNCYQFEELNRKVNRLIKGQDLIGDEFLKLFNSSRNFCLFVENLDEIENNKFVNFAKKHFSIKTSNHKKTAQKSCYIKGGKVLKIQFNDYVEKFLNDKVNLNSDIFFFEFIYFNDIVYSVKKDTKFTNHVISLDGQFGLIQYIFRSDENFYFVCCHLIKSMSPFFIKNCENIKLNSKFSIYSRSSSYFLIDQNQFKFLKKHFIFVNENGLYMVTSFTGNHLFS